MIDYTALINTHFLSVKRLWQKARMHIREIRKEFNINFSHRMWLEIWLPQNKVHICSGNSGRGREKSGMLL